MDCSKHIILMGNLHQRGIIKMVRKMVYGLIITKTDK